MQCVCTATQYTGCVSSVQIKHECLECFLYRMKSMANSDVSFLCVSFHNMCRFRKHTNNYNDVDLCPENVFRVADDTRADDTLFFFAVNTLCN